MHDLGLETGSSVTLMLAVAATTILLTGAFYYREFGMLKPGQWQLLLLLRVVAILIVVILLFRPVLSYEESRHKSPPSSSWSTPQPR